MERSFQNVTWPGWETVDILGHGNFGAVYKIQRTIRGRTEYAALKVIRIPKEESEIAKLRQDDYDDESITQYYADCLNKIEDEYAMMAELKGYANIVYCDDFFSQPHEDGFGWDIYIKMELLTPLKAYLPAEIPEEQAISLGIDICNALTRCEELKIVHRDIKPENIFVSKEGKYKLGDFGIARTMEGTTGGTKTGTFDYMAPEVNNSKAYHTEVDIYSLGLVMYWMLNERTGPFLPLGGKKPTPSMKQAAWDRRFAGEQIPMPKNGSEELKAIVLKACAYDPKERYQSAKEMLAALEAVQMGKASFVVTIPTKEPAIDEELTVGPGWSNDAEEPMAEDTMTVGPTWHKVPAEEDNDVTVGPIFQGKKKEYNKEKTGSKRAQVAPKHKMKKWWLPAIVAVACVLLSLVLFGRDKDDRNLDEIKPHKDEAGYTIDDTNPSLVYEKDVDGNAVKTTYKDPDGNVLAWYESSYSANGQEKTRRGYHADGSPMFTYSFVNKENETIISAIRYGDTEEQEYTITVRFDSYGNVIEKESMWSNEYTTWNQYHYDNKNREIYQASDGLGEMYVVTEYLEDALPDRVIENEIWMLPGDQVSQVVEKVHRDGILEAYTVWNIDGSGNRMVNAIATYEPLGSSKWMIEKFVRESDKSEKTSYRLFDEAGNEVGVIGLAPDGQYSNHFIRIPDVLGGNTFENYDIPVPEEKHGHVWIDGWCSFCGAVIDEGDESVFEAGEEFIAVSAGGLHTIGITSENSVTIVGSNNYGECDLPEDCAVQSAAAGWSHIAYLKTDGTVIALGDNSYGRCDVSGWNNIIALAADATNTVGLKSDGTVVAVGKNLYNNLDVEGWRDVVGISAGQSHTLGLKADGTVLLAGETDHTWMNWKPSEWKNVKSIHSTTNFGFGLKYDGTVVTTATDTLSIVREWTDIVDLATAGYDVIGLKSDGTVVATDSKLMDVDLSGWTDIVDVEAGLYHFIGIKADGTILASGDNHSGECDIWEWRYRKTD